MGDVIFEVVKVIEEKCMGKEKCYILFMCCLVCGFFVECKFGEVVFCCIGCNCVVKFKESFCYFVMKDVFNVEGMGEKIVELLVDEGFVKKFLDIFCFIVVWFLEFEGFVEKLSENLIVLI